jgi:hypothetical protein
MSSPLKTSQKSLVNDVLFVLPLPHSVPKYKHLLTFPVTFDRSSYSKNYENIIYFVMTYFIIVYILSIS